MCTFQTCTLFSARILALTSSRLPSMPSFPPILPIASTLRELQWAISNAEISWRTKCTFERCTFVPPWFQRAVKGGRQKEFHHFFIFWWLFGYFFWGFRDILEEGENPHPHTFSLTKKIALIFFSLPLRKRQGKLPKKQGFIVLPDPWVPWKRRETRSKRKGILEKTKPRKSKKARKRRLEKRPVLLRADFVLTKDLQEGVL